MTKLIIQIPCFNEEDTLPLVLKEIPASIEGVDSIEVQIVNDGSTDKTEEVARSYGVKHIVRNTGNKGLGISFRVGVEQALINGADILVNTDGDNQYPSRFIPELIKPILLKEADIVVGNRQTSNIAHFSRLKKFFQWLGTKVTIFLSGEKDMEDAVSGFRAYSKEALKELNITSDFSYVLDTTVQAANKKLKMVSVPITTNAPTRPSRLFKNMWQHIRKSGTDIVRVYSMYQPLRIFLWLSGISFLVGLIPVVRFVFYYFNNDASGKTQSLILGAMLIIISVNFFALGIIGDLLAKNRKLIEQISKRQKDELYGN